MNASVETDVRRALPVGVIGFGLALLSTVLGVTGMVYSVRTMGDAANRAMATGPAGGFRSEVRKADADARILAIIDGLPADGDLAMAMGAFNQLRELNDAYVDFAETDLYTSPAGESFCGKAGTSATGPWTNFIAYRGSADQVKLMTPTPLSKAPTCQAAVDRMLTSEPINISLIANLGDACAPDDTLFWQTWMSRCRIPLPR